MFDETCDIWGLNEEQKTRLAGTSELAQLAENGTLKPATLERLASVMSIQNSIELLFEDPNTRARWIHAPNDGFEGRSALEVMLSSPEDLHRVQLYLKRVAPVPASLNLGFGRLGPPWYY